MSGKIELWKHQRECVEQSRDFEKCLINIWCGCGKTRIIVYKIFDDNQNLNVIIFPSLGLINQFNNDYILKDEWSDMFKKYKFMSFCSDNESKLKIKTQKITYTTDELILQTFLTKKSKKILTVTYQSFEKFVDIVIENNIRVNRLYYDEAHHIVGDSIQKTVFQNDKWCSLVDKTEYYTETPINKNGITMYDPDCEIGDCGPLTYKYLYCDAIDDKRCKEIETQVTLYTILETYKNPYHAIFETIIRACLSGKYNYWNILTYHSFVNTNDNSVNDFAQESNVEYFAKLFRKIKKKDFPKSN